MQSSEQPTARMSDAAPLASASPPPQPAAPSPFAPFRRRDFVLLYLTNLAEFFATTLSRLSALQWLFEATLDARALGAIGAVTLVCQVPAIALGGVLADSLRRAPLVSAVQSAAALVALSRAALCARGALSPPLLYLTVGMLEVTARLEAPARSALLAACVPPAELPHAVSLVTITQYAGEIVAPFVFWRLADAAGTLVLPFLAAALAFALCAALPRLIAPPPRAAAAAARPAGVRAAWLRGLRAMVEGVRYILSHPLLPGLYALDWGFTCVSFYRELFPLWVGQWLTADVPAGLSSRGAVALCVVANFGGAMAGSAATLCVNRYAYKGRLVVGATAAYGVGCFLFGCTRRFALGVAAIAAMGACDAVGATMRKQVVLLTTPDQLRGRAQSGHQMAAYVANSIGQMYVGFMVGQVGAGTTMKLGGVVTELMTLLSVYCIPALVLHRSGPALEPPARLGKADDADVEQDGWQLNDAARAARSAGSSLATAPEDPPARLACAAAS